MCFQDSEMDFQSLPPSPTWERGNEHCIQATSSLTLSIFLPIHIPPAPLLPLSGFLFCCYAMPAKSIYLVIYVGNPWREISKYKNVYVATCICGSPFSRKKPTALFLICSPFLTFPKYPYLLCLTCKEKGGEKEKKEIDKIMW